MEVYGPSYGLHNMDKYQFLESIWKGNSATIVKMQDTRTGEPVAVKLIKRGDQVSKHVEEIVNHRSLAHPNIVRFKEITATPSHLAMVMEFIPYTPTGFRSVSELAKRGPLQEDVARLLFQHLISGVSYIHSNAISHQDLKLDNFLLKYTDVGIGPCLKICDFSSSIISFLRPDDPKALVGTPAYMAPEVWDSNLSEHASEYNVEIADVWSIGVSLFRMITGSYPFGRPGTKSEIIDTQKRVHERQFSPIRTDVQISLDCRDLLDRILVRNPTQRITLSEIQEHKWFRVNLQPDLGDSDKLYEFRDKSSQSTPEMLQIIRECKTIEYGAATSGCAIPRYDAW